MVDIIAALHLLTLLCQFSRDFESASLPFSACAMHANRCYMELVTCCLYCAKVASFGTEKPVYSNYVIRKQKEMNII